jgi:acyl-CoA thioesterase
MSDDTPQVTDDTQATDDSPRKTIDAPRGIPLDRATELEGEEGSYSLLLSRAWEIWGASGGYLAAIALRAAGMHAELPRPASFYCHFLRAPEFDRVELEVSFLKRSRRSEGLAVRMTQQGKEILQALVRTTTDAPGYEHQQGQSPVVAPPAQLRSDEELWRTHKHPIFSFWENIERRPTERLRKPPAPAVVREWTRFRPCASFADPFVDAARPLILLDTYGWPAAFRTHRDGRFIAPNLDTSAWFHRSGESSEWLLIDHECPSGADGLLGVGGRVWDERGRLLATGGAQLCCVPVS